MVTGLTIADESVRQKNFYPQYLREHLCLFVPREPAEQVLPERAVTVDSR
jgi:hypothetical protein